MWSKVVCRSISTSNFKNRIARKLRDIILLHLNFSVSFPKTRKAIMFMIGGNYWSWPWPPETILLDLGPSKLLITTKENHESFWKIVFRWFVCILLPCLLCFCVCMLINGLNQIMKGFDLLFVLFSVNYLPFQWINYVFYHQLH